MRGEKYSGKTCGRCGGTVRYVATKRCVECQSRYVKLSRQQSPVRNSMVGKPCEICEQPMEIPHYDEFPDSNTFRGWLCQRCNLGLGFFLDSPEVLRNAFSYLTKRNAF